MAKSAIQQIVKLNSSDDELFQQFVAGEEATKQTTGFLFAFKNSGSKTVYAFYDAIGIHDPNSLKRGQRYVLVN